MLDLETFLTTLYVMVDDFCQSPIHKNGALAHRLPSLIARWLPLPSSLVGAVSPASGTSTAMPQASCEMLSPPCLIAPSSIAPCVPR